MKRIIPVLLLSLAFMTCFSQVTQTVKGKVVDRVTGIGLPGAVVQLHSATFLATTSDEEGDYKLRDVPVGRQTFMVNYTGYSRVTLNDIVVTSGKELVLNVELEENAIAMDEVEVRASSDTDVVNTMQAVNMKSFSIEETERYPGSRQDPARMAQNFAGVQGTNDSRNDIVVRGNSPAGLLWRLEDVDIPNPNHFAIAGSAGGPQAIINNKYLSNSEFYTGAFPAQYGNALGGVFDLKMRNGNNEKHERTFQLGVLGTELTLEGPISRKSGASYLLNYRYSTLALFGSVNFKLGTSAIPSYQDGSIRLNFPTKKAGVISFTGIGGFSDIAIILSNINERPKELYGDQNRDQYFRSGMGTAILGHVVSPNSRTVMKTTLAHSGQYISSDHFLILRNRDFVPKDTLPRILGYEFLESRTTLAWYVKNKINQANSLKAGFFVNRLEVNYTDSIKFNSLYDTVPTGIHNKPFKKRMGTYEDFFLIQPYFSFVHKFSNELSVNTGVIAQCLTLNGRASVEPRANIRWQFNGRNVISLAYGLHSQMQATYLYFTQPDSVVTNGVLAPNVNKEFTNRNLDFSRSHHLVLGHDFFASRYLKFKTEVYYQQLWSVPVYVVSSGVSAINRGATFNRFFPVYTMVNNGTGYNYGIELTIEKLYHRHYFLMFSGSLFESKYTASNGRTFDTDFNGNYMFNLLTGVEYNVGRGGKDMISAGTKFTYGGGKRYSPVNRAASDAIMDVVPVDDQVNTLQFPAYNRLDLRISYRINTKRVGIEIAADVVNVLNTRNILALSYAPDPADLTKDPWVRNYQLGLLPLFYVKFDF
jgi:hypothetical protein